MKWRKKQNYVFRHLFIFMFIREINIGLIVTIYGLIHLDDISGMHKTPPMYHSWHTVFFHS